MYSKYSYDVPGNAEKPTYQMRFGSVVVVPGMLLLVETSNGTIICADIVVLI